MGLETRLVTWLEEREYRRFAKKDFESKKSALKAIALLGADWGLTSLSEAMNILPSPAWINGVDTSHYSVRRPTTGGYVYAPWDWKRTEEVFWVNVAKASQGTAKDPFYSAQIATMKASSTHAKYASYAFFDPSVSAFAAATTFCNAVEAGGGYGFAVVVDCERKPLTMSSFWYLKYLASFVYEVEKRLRAAHSTAFVAIYSRASFWNPIWAGGGRPTWTANYRQWVAIYPYDRLSASDYLLLCRSILYSGYVPPLPAKMMGLGEMVGWQWTEKVPRELIPGHNMIKVVEDGNLFLASILAIEPPAPPAIPEPAEPLIMSVVAQSLNVRTGPSISSPTFGSMPTGTTLVVEDVDGTDAWVAHFYNGQIGWSKVKSNGVPLLKKI